MTIAGKILRRVAPAAIGAILGSIILPGVGTALGAKLGLAGGISAGAGAALGGVAGLFAGSKAGKNWIAGTTGSSLTQAQQEQNEFTMLQQLRQQEFNSNEAALNRDWQEQMDSTKYQRQTADMTAAGLNPALMYGSSISSAGNLSGGAASSAAPAGASSANVSGGLLDSLISLIFVKERLSNLRKEGKVLESEKNKNDADAELARSNKSVADSNARLNGLIADYYPRLTSTTISSIQTGISEAWSRISVNRAQVANLNADSALKDVQSFAQRLQNEWIDRLNDAKRRNDLAGAAQKLAESAMTDYTLEFAKSHGGQLPGYNQWLGVGAAFADVLESIGWSSDSKSVFDIDWKSFLFKPFGHWKELFGKNE